MTLIHVIDWLTGIASFGVKFIGFPAQMRHNHQAGQAGQRSGLAPGLAGAFLVSYVLWVTHGVIHHDLVEVVSQGIGVVTTGVLLGQGWWYVRRQRTTARKQVRLEGPGLERPGAEGPASP